MRATESPKYIFNGAEVVGFGCNELRVETVPAFIVRSVIEKFHYSHTSVNNSWVNLGVFCGRNLSGVIAMGYALNPNSGARVVQGTSNKEYLELNRLWLHGSLPKCTGSRVLGYTMKFLRRAHPQVAWVQSFADARCRLGGVIYQASNFHFIGSHVAKFWELDGKFFHKIAATAQSEKIGDRGRYLQENLDRAVIHEFAQYRYIKFLHRGAHKRLLKKIRPYPKITRA